jgi:hypothetical protein
MTLLRACVPVQLLFVALPFWRFLTACSARQWWRHQSPAAAPAPQFVPRPGPDLTCSAQMFPVPRQEIPIKPVLVKASRTQ